MVVEVIDKPGLSLYYCYYYYYYYYYLRFLSKKNFSVKCQIHLISQARVSLLFTTHV